MMTSPELRPTLIPKKAKGIKYHGRSLYLEWNKNSDWIELAKALRSSENVYKLIKAFLKWFKKFSFEISTYNIEKLHTKNFWWLCLMNEWPDYLSKAFEIKIVCLWLWIGNWKFLILLQINWIWHLWKEYISTSILVSLTWWMNIDVFQTNWIFCNKRGWYIYANLCFSLTI